MGSREVLPPFPVYVRGDDSCTGWAVRKHRLSDSLWPGTNRTFLWDCPVEVNELILTHEQMGAPGQGAGCLSWFLERSGAPA